MHFDETDLDLFIHSIRDFSNKELLPNTLKWEDNKAFSEDLWEKFGALGLMGMLVPDHYGGSETGYEVFAHAIMEIAKGDGGASTVMSVQNSVVCGPINKYGSNAQKERYLPGLCDGSMIGAFCLTEPHAGSDASALKTTAKYDEENGHYTLNGTKCFITSGKIAGLAIIFAVTDPDAGKKGMSCFIVPTDNPGYKVIKVEDKMGQNASDTCMIALEDCIVPSDHMIGKPGDGYKIALSNLEGGRIGIAAQAVGMAEAAFHEARKYANERTSFNKPLSEHQHIGFMLSEMATNIEASRQLVLHAARLMDAGKPALRYAAMAKLHASEMAETVCSQAVQIFGGYGYIRDYLVEKIYRDIRVCKIYEGTSEIQKIIIQKTF